MKVGIIGGTGLYKAGIIDNLEEKNVITKYGDANLMQGKVGDHQVYFLNRHGVGHKVPPHLINYKANIYALKQLEVEKIIATAAVGSLKKDIVPGTLVFLDQFIDFTSGREHTFFTGQSNGVVHVDLTEPYCPDIRKLLIETAKEAELTMREKGTYVCTQGPRFETPAEITMFTGLGGDVVGMTNVPEVVLAREAEICYGTVAVVTNYAAGISTTNLSHEEVLQVMADNEENLEHLIGNLLKKIGNQTQCFCARSVSSQSKLSWGINDG